MQNVYEVNKVFIIEVEREEFDMFANEFIKDPDNEIFINKTGKRMCIIEIYELEESQIEMLETLIGRTLDVFNNIRMIEK